MNFWKQRGYRIKEGGKNCARKRKKMALTGEYSQNISGYQREKG
jgi:hypothetical protein